MADTYKGKVRYTPHPEPHRETRDAPRTGVPTSPAPPRSVPPLPTVKRYKP